VYTPFRSDSLREETTWKTWCVWEDNFKVSLRK